MRGIKGDLMPTPTTELGKRLTRWQLAHTAPAPLSIDHPVQVDLAAAIDEIERLHAKITKADYLLTQGAQTLALEALQTTP